MTVSSDLLAKCLTQIETGERTLEQCLAEHAAEADELADLLRVALAIAPLPPLEPDPAFRARGRAALLAAIAAERAEATGGARGRFWAALAGLSRRARLASAPAALLLALLAMLGLGGGAVYAAQDALPGDALYPLKGAYEQVRFQLALSEAGQLQVHLELAAQRIAEIDRLAAQGRLAAVSTLADAYARHVEAAAALAAKAPAGAGDGADGLENLSRHEEVLLRVQAQAPEAAQPALLRALAHTQAYEHGLRVGWQRRATAAATPSPDASAPSVPQVTPTPVSNPSSASLDQLASAVEQLGNSDLVPGETQQDLLAKLAAAKAALERGQQQTAANALAAFAHHLNAMQRSGHIAGQDYEALYEAYAALAAELGEAAVPAVATAKPERTPGPTERTPTPGDRQDEGKGPAKRNSPTPTPSATPADNGEREAPRNQNGRP